MKNHYNVLELDRNCTAKEIKDSYIKLSKRYHPDKNKSKEAEKKILEINEAYSVLKNSFTRHVYDANLRNSNIKEQQGRQNVRQNSWGSYYNKPRSYDEYVHYYKKMNVQGYPETSVFTRKFTVVLCCCMLMVFGTGLRIMHARLEAHERKKMIEMTQSSILETQSKVNPKVEELRFLLKKKRERESEKKKSDS